MNTPNNKRSRDTDEAIIRAAFELLAGGRPVSKITVREICDIAHINRSTFYAHYMDVYDLFEKVELQMAKMCSQAVMSNITSGGIQAALEGSFGFILAYREFYQLYFREFSGASHMIHLLLAPFQSQIEQVKSADMGYGVKQEAIYHFNFFTAGVSSLIAHWLATGCRETPHQLFEILERVYGENSLFNVWAGAV